MGRTLMMVATSHGIGVRAVASAEALAAKCQKPVVVGGRLHR